MLGFQNSGLNSWLPPPKNNRSVFPEKKDNRVDPFLRKLLQRVKIGPKDPQWNVFFERGVRYLVSFQSREEDSELSQS